MNLNEIKTEIVRHRAQIAELEATKMKLLQQGFSESAKVVFKKYPWLEQFSWTQYTPYWNDGSECVFHVRVYDDEGIDLNGIDVLDLEYDIKEGGAWPDELIGANMQAVKDAVAACAGLVHEMTEDELLEMFGDHAKISVNRNGTCDVTRYRHD